MDPLLYLDPKVRVVLLFPVLITKDIYRCRVICIIKTTICSLYFTLNAEKFILNASLIMNLYVKSVYVGSKLCQEPMLIGSWLCVKEFKCDKISLKTADVKIMFIVYLF